MSFSFFTRSLGWIVGLAGVGLLAGGEAQGLEGTHARLRPVPFTDVRIGEGFWLPRIETNRTVTLPHNLRWCEETGRISNFAKAGGLMEGEHEGAYFNDSDVYKVLEGAAYTLALHPDSALESRIDAIIDTIASAQQPDGYLNTYYTLKEPDQRWTNLSRMHELYCAGHLIEAAIAYHEATGKRKLLDVACRFADHIDSIFGHGKRLGYPGHQEIELALIKLYRHTGEERYRKLAEFFIEVRGQEDAHCPHHRDLESFQAHLPIEEQSEIVGHAVRAMYFYSGVADVAALTGDRGYLDAMERLWQNVTGRKMYITGGIGAEASYEGFATGYELPNDTAYAETCAAIGMALWNHRLLLLHGEGRFADVLERVLYNGILSGVSLDGSRFFYTNPLASFGQHGRSEWFGCACCPTNIVRFLPSIGGYIYAEGDDGVWVNLYVAGTADVTAGGQEVTLTQETDYPWSGQVTIAVEPKAASQFALHVRIPGWADDYSLSVNGQPVEGAEVVDGYVAITRTWKPGDKIELDLPMDVRRVYAHPRVTADVGKVALQHGPVVYCIEGFDNDGAARHLALPPTAELAARPVPDLLGGVVVVEADALALEPGDWGDALYRQDGLTRPAHLTAIPYYAWNNRRDALPPGHRQGQPSAPGQMTVWIPETAALADRPLTPCKAQDATVTASHTAPGSSVEAVNDNLRPRDSADRRMPRFSWGPRKGTTETITYKLPRPSMLSSVEVYWLVDDGHRLPVSWWVSWNRGGQWEPVAVTSAYPVEEDTFNRATFEPIPTLEIRLDVQLPEGATSGILEWRVD